jgi:hypothetical protein
MTEYLYIDHTGRQNGPVTAAGLRDLFRQGRLHRDTPVWRPGMKDWVPMRTLPGLIGPEPAPPPARLAPSRRPAVLKKNVALWAVLAGGGGLLVLGCGVVGVLVIVAAGGGGPLAGVGGGNQKPTQLNGDWSGTARIEFTNPGQIPPQVRQKAATVQVPVEFQCSPDGKVRFGLLGRTIATDLHAGLVKKKIPGSDSCTLEEFSTTADTCRFTIRDHTGAGWGFASGDHRDIQRFDARTQVTTFVFRRVGDEVQMEMTEANATGNDPLHTPPVVLKGRLRRK